MMVTDEGALGFAMQPSSRGTVAASATVLGNADLLLHILRNALDLRPLAAAAQISSHWRRCTELVRASLPQRRVRSLGTRGQSRAALDAPSVLCVLPDGNLACCERDRLRILDSASGSILATVDYPLPPSTSRFGRDPSGVACTSDGRFLFVADARHDVIMRIQLSAAPEYVAPEYVGQIRSWGGFGEDPGQLAGPGSLALDEAHGLLFTSEGLRVSCFCTDTWEGPARPFKFCIGQLGKRGRGACEFRNLGGLCVHEGVLFCADCGNQRVSTFDARTGAPLRTLCGRESGDDGVDMRPGRLTRPSDVCIWRGLLVVTELSGRRAQLLSLDGEPLQVLRTDGDSVYRAPGEQRRPAKCYAVAVAPRRERGRAPALFLASSGPVPLHVFE